MVLGLLIGAAALGGGFVATRNFVRRRLRFVDAVRKPAAPLVAGIAGGLAASGGALPLGNAGRTGVAICKVSNASATARIFTVSGSGSASMSQSSPTIS